MQCKRQAVRRVPDTLLHWSQHLQVFKTAFTACHFPSNRANYSFNLRPRGNDLSLPSVIKALFKRCVECQRELAMRKVSVRPSVKRVHCDKTEERSVQIFIPYERSFSLVFWEERWLVEGCTSNWPRWREIADFQSIIARSALAVAPSKKVQLTLNRKSTTRFPMSLRWPSYIAPKPLQGDSAKKPFYV